MESRTYKLAVPGYAHFSSQPVALGSSEKHKQSQSYNSMVIFKPSRYKLSFVNFHHAKKGPGCMEAIRVFKMLFMAFSSLVQQNEASGEYRRLR